MELKKLLTPWNRFKKEQQQAVPSQSPSRSFVSNGIVNVNQTCLHFHMAPIN